MGKPFLERWLEEVLATSGLTSLDSLEDARRVLLDDALRALPLLAETTGPVIDVGSGGGSPGIPLAVSLPDRAFTLLESQRRKVAFLERATDGLANVAVVWGRAEEQSVDMFGVALAKALGKAAGRGRALSSARPPGRGGDPVDGRDGGARSRRRRRRTACFKARGDARRARRAAKARSDAAGLSTSSGYGEEAAPHLKGATAGADSGSVRRHH